MDEELFQDLLDQCQPQGNFSQNWSAYRPDDFGETFLPDITEVQNHMKDGARYFHYFDGADLFEDAPKNESKVYNIFFTDVRFRLVTYTFPEGAPVEDHVNKLSIDKSEIGVIFRLSKSGEVQVSLKFSSHFQYALNTYLQRQRLTLKIPESPVFITDYASVKTHFKKGFNHEKLAKYLFTSIGIPTNAILKFITDVRWWNADGKEVPIQFHLNKDSAHLGEKVSLQITDSNLNGEVQLTIGYYDGTKLEFPEKDKRFNFKLTATNNTITSPEFVLPFEWFNETMIQFDMRRNVTLVANKQRLRILARVVVDGEVINIDASKSLIPWTYIGNYEEWLGLTEVNKNPGKNSEENNFRNHYISTNAKIEKIANDFVEHLYANPDTSAKDVKKMIERDSPKLWECAVEQVQDSDTVDDRPLYWARQKMELAIKRLPIFKEDIHFEASMIKDRSTLKDDILKPFEILSRNYEGISFEDAPNGAKKILVVSFDPYALNSNLHQLYDIRHSNASGCAALYLHGKTLDNGYIQSMILPVRYQDFDGKNSKVKGEGTGVVEEFVGPWIADVDMIVSMSQHIDNKIYIDRFATITRDGMQDNVFYTREKESDALTAEERWLETGLPDEMEDVNGVEMKWDYIVKEEVTENGKTIEKNVEKDGQTKPPVDDQDMLEGSGSNFLSNELFYRIANLREANNTNLPTGHLHIARIQQDGNEPIPAEVKKVMNNIEKSLIKGIQTL